jgi:predicted restriction endonuclease
LCLAISEIATNYVELYEIEEGGLTKLPHISKRTIESLGVVQIFTSNRTIERIDFEENDSLRSAQYIYNLLEKLGNKKCALCNCDIPQVIQGAHIWPVADIKKENHLTIEEKLTLALDGDNGLWLCNNHHKLLDINIIKLLENKNIKYKANLPENQINYLKEITVANELPENIMNESFTQYLTQRNQNIPEEDYSSFSE